MDCIVINKARACCDRERRSCTTDIPTLALREHANSGARLELFCTIALFEVSRLFRTFFEVWDAPSIPIILSPDQTDVARAVLVLSSPEATSREKIKWRNVVGKQNE